MAEPNNGTPNAENQTLEVDSEAMHVDSTPTTSDREDEVQNPAIQKSEEDSFAALFKEIPVIQEKLDQRAQRFGTELSSPLRLVTEAEVKALYKSLEINWRDANIDKSGKIRLNCIHMRGVEEMNTDDVFDYFKDQPPDSVEWVNDQSCNAIWVDPLCAARAMLTYSQPIKKSLQTVHKDTATEEVAIVSEPEEGEDVEMEQESVPTPQRTRSQSGGSESQQSHSRRDSGDPLRTPVPNNSPVDASQIEDSSPSDIGTEVDSSTLDVPIPPGPWRLGTSTEKAKAVLMRFAFRSDRKIAGAEKLSQYYLKYGNPNYQGLRGIISTSLKRKMRKTDYVDLDAVKDDFQEESGMLDFADLADVRQKEQTKRPRMRMYADDEEKKCKRVPVPLANVGLHPGDLRNRITYEKPSLPSSHGSSDSRDLRSKLGSRPPRSSHHSLSEDEGDYHSGSYSTVLDLSKPIIMGDLRSKLEKLRQSRQPKVPLLIEVSQDDV